MFVVTKFWTYYYLTFEFEGISTILAANIIESVHNIRETAGISGYC